MQTKELNLDARESLMKAISSQMELIQHDMSWKAKFGLDNAEFARVSAISGPMSEAIQYLSTSAKLFKETEVLFRGHSERMQALLDLAYKINGSEKE